jgi:hypothetical protein
MLPLVAIMCMAHMKEGPNGFWTADGPAVIEQIYQYRLGVLASQAPYSGSSYADYSYVPDMLSAAIFVYVDFPVASPITPEPVNPAPGTGLLSIVVDYNVVQAYKYVLHPGKTMPNPLPTTLVGRICVA